MKLNNRKTKSEKSIFRRKKLKLKMRAQEKHKTREKRGEINNIENVENDSTKHIK